MVRRLVERVMPSPCKRGGGDPRASCTDVSTCNRADRVYQKTRRTAKTCRIIRRRPNPGIAPFWASDCADARPCESRAGLPDPVSAGSSRSADTGRSLLR